MATFTSYTNIFDYRSPLLLDHTWFGGTATQAFSSAYPPGVLAYHRIEIDGRDFVYASDSLNAEPVSGHVHGVTYRINGLAWTLVGLDQPWMLGEVKTGYEVAGVVYTGLEAALARWLSGDDELIGSPYAEQLRGMAGNDVFRGSAGGDILDGGPGFDAVYYSGAFAAYDIEWRTDASTQASTPHVVHGADVDVLRSIERVHFEDRSVAFDLDASAGDALSLLATLGGSRYLDDAAVIGEFVWYVDGLGLMQAAELAVSSGLVSRLAGGSSDEAMLSYLVTNVTGAGPSAEDLQWNLNYMHEAGLSQAQVIELVANLDITRDFADLVGISTTGLEYVVYPG